MLHIVLGVWLSAGAVHFKRKQQCLPRHLQALRPLELLVALQNTSRAWARTEAPAARGFQSLARLGEVQALKLEAINSKMAPLELVRAVC